LTQSIQRDERIERLEPKPSYSIPTGQTSTTRCC